MPTLPRAAARRRDICRAGSKARPTGLLSVLILLLLVACSVPGSVRPTVKIGLVAPFEGRYRYIGYDLFAAVRLALRQANEAGGVGGYAVEFVAYDDGGDPEMAALQARKLALDPEVLVVIGHFREETTAAALPVYAQAGMPLLVPGILFDEDAEADGVIWLGPSADVVADELLDGVESAALLPGEGALGAALQRCAARRGIPLAVMGEPSAAYAAEVVICAADALACGEAVAALRAGGWRGEFRGGPELAAADFVAAAGEAAVGASFVTPWPFPGDVASEEWMAAYRDVSGGTSPGPLALPAYQATLLALDVLSRSAAAPGGPTRAGVAAALAADRPSELYWYRIAPEGVIQRETAPSS